MTTITSFEAIGVQAPLLRSLSELGYETPTPIQAQSIPILIAGKDLQAQAQTGTGKTAAFALPILLQIELSMVEPQALVVVPTRELAIQVAEAFQRYARHLPGFYVTSIYGGQDYPTQLRALRRGAQVIVGTPGRLMDHLRRGSLSFEKLKHIVLDEADEMLKMGFIDDVEWILEQIPKGHQTSLFSATMPNSIQQIAKRYLNDPHKIQVKSTESTVTAIEQFYTKVAGNQKLDVLTRFLEVENIQAAIIFTRTKTCSTELAEKLQARGYAASALNGDLSQPLRKKVIERIKDGSLDIIVATDVAARGIDVDRISHVINYDIPCDTETYIHRIGRTGRAGRAGRALMLITPREYYLLRDIERALHQTIRVLEAPSINMMRQKRSEQLAEKIIAATQDAKALQPYREMVNVIIEQSSLSVDDIAAGLAFLNQKANPIAVQEIKAEPEFERSRRNDSGRKFQRRPGFQDRGRPRESSDRDRFRDGNDRGRQFNDRDSPRGPTERDKFHDNKDRFQNAKDRPHNANPRGEFRDKEQGKPRDSYDRDRFRDDKPRGGKPKRKRTDS